MRILLSIGGALMAIIALLVIPRANATRLLPGKASEPSSMSITGGGVWLHTYWPVAATWPLVRFELFSWGMRIGPSSTKVSWALPTTEIAWTELRSATPTRTGIRLRRTGARGWVVFTSMSGLPRELWRQFHDHGVPTGE